MANSRLSDVLGRFPGFTERENPKSRIYNVMSALVTEIDKMRIDIDRIHDMVGIDTTHDDDLVSRWGNLLLIPRRANESEESYRSRLKISVTVLAGGTADAIKYSIAVGMNINNNPVAMDKRIKVFDAWKYTGTESALPRDPGNVICIVDLDNQIYSNEMESIVINSANAVKIAGVKVHIVFINYRIIKYIDMNVFEYYKLNKLEYNKMGG